jgi:NAD(P)H-nitrite reductase large subunit
MPATSEIAGSETIVCACFRVTESTVLDAIAQWNLSSVKEVCQRTNAGAGCTACRLRIRKYLVPSNCEGCPGNGGSACG